MSAAQSLLNLDTVYQTVQSTPHGHSGRGVSFWRSANQCGRLAQLTAANPPPQAEASDEENGARAGTFYHALHEAGLAGQHAGQVWDMTDTVIQDIDWLEALRLYRAYTKDWVSPTAKWGARSLGVETKLPSKPETKALVRELFGEDVTFRADWVGEITDVESVRQRTGLYLPEPGIYIFDHKTSKSRKGIHEWEYTFGNQTQVYLHLYNLENPDRPAKGMIYDQILKHTDITKDAVYTKTGTLKRESSYEHFLGLPSEDAEKVIRNLVVEGMHNLAWGGGLGKPNGAHCFSGYKPCWFFQNGMCQRY